MNYTTAAKANDERRWATEAMHDRMDRKRDNERFYDAHSLPDVWPKDAKSRPIGVQLPHLTVEAATARISVLNEIADDWLYSRGGLNPKLFENELARLLAFIAERAKTSDQPPTAP